MGVHYRSFEITRAAVDSNSRTVELSFSSETPVEQYDWDGRYYEILDHSRTSVILDRLKSAAPLLMDHNRCDQVGVVDEAAIGEDRRGRAKVRFSTSARAEEIFQDVKAGIRRLVSFGYRVYELVTDKIEGEVETLRAMRWEPFEISIVSVPADITVGIGRNEKAEKHKVTINTMKLSQRNLDPSAGPAAAGGGSAATPAAPQPTPAAAPATPQSPNVNTGAGARADYQEMFALAKRLNAIATFERAVNEGWDLAEFRKQVLESRASAPIPGVSGPAPTNAEQMRSMSIGQRFVNSESYRSQQGKKGRQRAIVLEIPDECQFRASNPFNASTEALTSIQKLGGVQILDQQPLRVAALMAQGTTDGLTVRYIAEETYTQAATAVAEGSSKPAASLDVVEVDATVRKIAVYTKVTEEMADDFQQMQSYINARLAYMVGALEDNHLINGTGNSNQIKGILNFSGIQTVSGALSPPDGIFKAISYVRGANGSGFVEPDAVIIHPLDYMNIKLTKDSNGQYLGGGPFFGQYGQGGFTNVGMIWGLPAVITTSIAQGTALTGAFRFASQIFRRMGLTVESTNSDQDDFIKNLMTIRAEERLALACYKPAAFCTVTGMPA